jgi:hypothetical protein
MRCAGCAGIYEALEQLQKAVHLLGCSAACFKRKAPCLEELILQSVDLGLLLF